MIGDVPLPWSNPVSVIAPVPPLPTAKVPLIFESVVVAVQVGIPLRK